MKRKTGISLFLLLACLFLRLCTASALTSGDFEYTLNDDGTAEITKYTGTAAELVIPAALDGHPVTSLGSRAIHQIRNLTSVTIPDSVRRICENAITTCYDLTSVTIPEGVVIIGDGAFSHCYKLTEVAIPDSVTEVGFNPWYGCQKLTSIHVSPSQPILKVVDGVLYSKDGGRLICCPVGLKYTSFDIPRGTITIGKLAFFECAALTTVTIPDSVKRIESEAFWYCQSLRNVTIPDTVAYIGSSAFSHCGVITLTVGRGSYAEGYCVKNKVYFRFPDYLDWLAE